MTATKGGKRTAGGSWQVSWKHFFIVASVTANIAFVVVIITMITSHALDGMFMNEGLKRYCDSANDEKFEDNNERTIALRQYTCERGDAAAYFKNGFEQYLDFKNIPRVTE